MGTGDSSSFERLRRLLPVKSVFTDGVHSLSGVAVGESCQWTVDRD